MQRKVTHPTTFFRLLRALLGGITTGKQVMRL